MQMRRNLSAGMLIRIALVVVCLVRFLIMHNALTTTTAAKSQKSTTTNVNVTVPVFYNLFVAKQSDIPRVEDLVAQQLRELLPEHRISCIPSEFP
jgi:hypothetical protein